MNEPLYTPEEFAGEMEVLAMRKDYDEEDRHFAMDALMGTLLKDLGYEEGVEIFENTAKWYG